MHGRVKTKSSEEKRLEEKLAAEKRDLKFNLLVNKYFEIRSTIFSIESDQTDSINENLITEALSLSAQILRDSPEWFTLWNDRRRIIIINLMLIDPEFEALGSNGWEQKELDLILFCLKENPKAYSVWHHRQWVMLKHSNPDWSGEVKLCNHALNLDERNFHCWDYRRFVAKNGKLSFQSEVKFSREKISDISNFSSWHYRYVLFKESKENSKQDLISKELDLVHNAIFTDPNDQSAWLYYRWPLGELNSDDSTKHIVNLMFQLYVDRSKKLVVLLLSQPIDVVQLKNSRFFSDSQTFDCSDLEWISTNSASKDYSQLFFIDFSRNKILQSQEDIEFTVELGSDAACASVKLSSNDVTKYCSNSEKVKDFIYHNRQKDVDKELLESELHTLQSLLQEEPFNKWAIYNCYKIMARLISNTEKDSKALDNIYSLIDRLIEVDPCRKGFYLDLISKTKWTSALACFDFSNESMSFKNQSLTAVGNCEVLCRLVELDLSYNNFVSFPNEMCHFICLEKLIFNNNKLRTLKGVDKMLSLRILCLNDNQICKFENFSFVLSCRNLDEVHLSGNEIIELSDFSDLVRNNPASRAHHHHLNIIYDWVTPPNR